MAEAPSFAKLVPGFDFLQSLVKNAGSALPSIGQWVAPTLDPEELEKRIGELRTVKFWLEQNARMLEATIQALEVQRMTLVDPEDDERADGGPARFAADPPARRSSPRRPQPIPLPTAPTPMPVTLGTPADEATTARQSRRGREEARPACDPPHQRGAGRRRTAGRRPARSTRCSGGGRSPSSSPNSPPTR